MIEYPSVSVRVGRVTGMLRVQLLRPCEKRNCGTNCSVMRGVRAGMCESCVDAGSADRVARPGLRWT